MNNYKLKKSIYIALLSSLLITGCSNKENNEQQDLDTKIEIEYEENNNEEIVIEETKEPDIVLPEEVFEKEEEVVGYFDKLKEDVELLLTINNEEAKNKIEARVMTYVNFITENIELGGYYFKDLSEEAKVAIKAKYIQLDQMIEEKIPGYREILSEKSEKFKEYVKTSYNTIKEQVIKWNKEGTLKENLYNGIFDRLDDDIDQTKDTFKNLYDKAKEKIKNWN